MRIASIDGERVQPEERCGACRLCEAVCVLVHERVANPKRSRIRIHTHIDENHHMHMEQIVCNQCCDEEVPPCADACPSEAIVLDPVDGLWKVDLRECLGCGACVDECPYGAIFMDPVSMTALKCDLCGGDPQCVAICPSQVLVLAEE
jgi:carbon-monoxide dehydrogenase iron sulfur subunit